MSDVLVMSTLPKTWILDLDGTLLKHNGYKLDGHDSLLEGVEDFLSNIKSDDMVIIVTSRKLEYKEMTENFLRDNNIRFNHIIYEAPYGERIVVNDNKQSGLQMAYSISKKRDGIIDCIVFENENI